MYLSVQLAARRLGVSPHTIRRWTASGFLPCTRTAGGHRRIKQEDIDELSHLIGGRNHLAARLARERELETLVATAIAVSSQLDVTALLREVAKQMTTLLDAHLCVISDYDPATRRVTVRAEYDDVGNRHQDTMTYTLSQFPMARRAIEDHESITINVSDPHADAGGGRHHAPRRRQVPAHPADGASGSEHRPHRGARPPARAQVQPPGDAARQRGGGAGGGRGPQRHRLRAAHAQRQGLRSPCGTPSRPSRPGTRPCTIRPLLPGSCRPPPKIAAQALGAISCVASYGGESAGASGLRPGDQAAQSGTAHVIVVVRAVR